MIFSLSDLETIVATRATSGDPASYTAQLARKGIGKASKKLGEEAVECAIAAVSEDDAAVTSEAADLLYHLMVVLHLREVPLGAVMAELQRRTAETGLEEKARRPVDPVSAGTAGT
ncbi:MAG: phosphoribosyl-ATP diphosphatase [Hyphomicrobiales bacterium]|nr:MAG: phosphoribosyl-ATP diphosphatase [Hyphomicrobiales bacterium]